VPYSQTLSVPEHAAYAYQLEWGSAMPPGLTCHRRVSAAHGAGYRYYVIPSTSRMRPTTSSGKLPVTIALAAPSGG